MVWQRDRTLGLYYKNRSLAPLMIQIEPVIQSYLMTVLCQKVVDSNKNYPPQQSKESCLATEWEKLNRSDRFKLKNGHNRYEYECFKWPALGFFGQQET